MVPKRLLPLKENTSYVIIKAVYPAARVAKGSNINED